MKTKITGGDGPWKETFYRDTETGFPVMLVHGFPADGSLWDRQIPRLRESCRLIIPDLPGSGASPLTGPISIEEMAEALRGILDDAGITRCVMIGHSMGGYAALAFAEKYPERLGGLGLFHSTAFQDSPDKKEGRLRSMELMRRYGGPRFLRQMIPNLFTARFRQAHPEVLRHLVERAEKAPAEGLLQYYEAMRNRPDRSEVLRRSDVPVLFVIGQEDSAVPAADVLKQVSLPAVSQVHLWREVAHMGMLETPDRATEALAAFVSFCRRSPDFTAE